MQVSMQHREWRARTFIRERFKRYNVNLVLNWFTNVVLEREKTEEKY